MSSREKCQQLLERIDTVLEECGKDPRRRRPPTTTRAPWTGPTWLQGQQAGAGLSR